MKRREEYNHRLELPSIEAISYAAQNQLTILKAKSLNQATYFTQNLPCRFCLDIGRHLFLQPLNQQS